MALQADPYFGFDLIQRKTLAELLANAGTDPDLVAAVADLEDRVAALEAAP